MVEQSFHEPNDADVLDPRDAEQQRLLAWADGQAVLTERAIERQIALSREKLEVLGVRDIKFFVRLVRWRLLKRMASQDLDILDAPEEELAAMEGRGTDGSGADGDGKALADARKPKQVIIGAGAVFTDEQMEREEDAHETFGTIPKGIRGNLKKWLKHHAEHAARLDERTVGALALPLLDKQDRRFAAFTHAPAYLAFVRHRMEKSSPSSAGKHDVPLLLEWDLPVEADFAPPERAALRYFAARQALDDGKKPPKVTPEEVFLVTGETAFDQYECPLCIRSLEQKLQGTGLLLDIKVKFGQRHHFQGSQGSVVQWIRLCFKDDAD